MERRKILKSLESFVKNMPNNHNHLYYLTNIYTDSFLEHQSHIQAFQNHSHIKFIPSYKSATSHLNPKKTSLLIGDPYPQLYQHLSPTYKFITLEQLCSLFPSKVPLSYRSQDNKALKDFVEKRLNQELSSQPKIHSVLITKQIKQWDQALQVLLDLNVQECQFIIEFHRQKQKTGYYSLKMNDFVNALRTCYKTIHENHEPKIINYNEENKQVQWILREIKEMQLEIDDSLVHQL